MPAGKWGVEVREEIGGKHYVTPGPGPGFIRGGKKTAGAGWKGGATDSFSKSWSVTFV